MPERKDKSPKEQKEVLDLLGGSAKKARASKSKKSEATPKIAPTKKKETLDLLSPVKRKRKAVAEVSPEPKEESPVVSKKTTAEKKSVKKEEGVKENSSVSSSTESVIIKGSMTVAELAAAAKVKGFRIIKVLLVELNVFAKNETLLDVAKIEAVCSKMNIPYEREKREKGAGVHKTPVVAAEPEPGVTAVAPKPPVKKVKTKNKETKKDVKASAKKGNSEAVIRTPIVTIMGHVDHGKTTLLDYIRKSKVTEGEFGGITQHIAAYTVEHNGQDITFLDTPGHAIFTAMRARGADVTDIIVIVVAANDGIMPQTREAIAHAKAANKTIIIAVNKCDLPVADPVRARTELMEEGLVVTDFGGDIECVDISALTGQGVEDLLDLLILQAEVLELKANPKNNCRAAIIEACVQSGKGITATVIIEEGTLKVGTPFICGSYSGKVRSMLNDRGEQVKKALPGMPVEVVGFDQIPNVGDEIVEMESDRAAKKLSEERQMVDRQNRLKAPRKSRMEDIMSLMSPDNQKAQLKVILKADVQGSVEAIKKAIGDIKSDKVETIFLNAAAGPISESDILLASSSDAVILGFNVKVEANAVRAAKKEGVQVKLYSIVYELIDQVREAMLGLLTPETRETVIGHALVKQVFKLNKGRAAGCIIEDGKVERTAGARVIRDGQPVFDGKMSTLRRYQDEVNEVKDGMECGIRLGDFNEYEEGDIIECYTLEKIKQTL